MTSIIDRSHCPATVHGRAHHRRRGCTCPDTRAAWALYRKRWKHGLNPNSQIDPTGTCRRIRAMLANGWRVADLVALTGLSNNSITRFAQGNAVYVFPATFQAVARAYQHAGFHLGPSPLARTRYRNAGYDLAIAWDDIDDPTEKPQRTNAEPVSGNRGGGCPQVDDAMVDELTGLGRSAAEIALELGVKERTVVRARARARLRASDEDTAA